MKQEELWDHISQKYSSFLVNLFSRWQEEQEYEDIGDYLKAIQRHIPEATAVNWEFQIKFTAEDGALVLEFEEQGSNLIMSGYPNESRYKEAPEQGADIGQDISL